MFSEALCDALKEIQAAASQRYMKCENAWKKRVGRIRGDEREVFETADRYDFRRRLIPEQDGLGLERIIDDNNLFHINYFEQARRAARSVGRIHVIDQSGIPSGFGTGFLVAPGVALTNNHVLKSSGSAARSLIEFDFEYDLSFRPRSTTIFELDPASLFFTSVPLDFSLVAVSSQSVDGTGLAEFGRLTLIPDSGKALTGEPVSIIQHPSGGFKRVALRDSRILGIPGAPDDDFIHYTTDTEPGSSGSPVLNDQWRVVALHHSGVPGPGGTWIANEGIRVSRIFAALRRAEDEGDEHSREALERLDLPLAADDQDTDHPSITVSEAPSTSPFTARDGGEAEAASFDPARWEATIGYDPDFLGEGNRAPLPLPRDNMADVTRFDGDEYELKYTHFSVVMSESRRMAFVAAANIDGGALKRVKRNDNWRLDPRMKSKLQIDNDCYRHNDLDRGHLVRRLAPVWGPTLTAKEANEDTFHYTNCAPQHKNLNQKTWLDLEDYILETADREDAKACVFTGPVFRPDDMLYRGEYLIPAEYWKVAVSLDQRGRLASAGYLQTQKHLLPNVKEAFGDYRTYRVPVATIAALTGLDFGALADADSSSRREASGAIRVVRRPEDVDLF